MNFYIFTKQIIISVALRLFKVKGDFREECIGFSGEARFLFHS